MAGLFLVLSSTLAGKLLPAPELTNLRRAWIQLHYGHSAVTSIKAHTGRVFSPNKSRNSGLLGKKQPTTHQLYTCIPL